MPNTSSKGKNSIKRRKRKRCRARRGTLMPGERVALRALRADQLGVLRPSPPPFEYRHQDMPVPTPAPAVPHTRPHRQAQRGLRLHRQTILRRRRCTLLGQPPRCGRNSWRKGQRLPRSSLTSVHWQDSVSWACTYFAGSQYKSEIQ